MTNEAFLLTTIKKCIYGMEMNIKCFHDFKGGIPADFEFECGRVAGLQNAVDALHATLRLYERKVEGTLPEEMLES